MIAAREGHLAIVKILINHGANVNNKNMSLSLKDMLDELSSREFPFNHIVKMLDKVDFRYKRNTGTHNGIMRPEDIWPIQKMMMKEDGILNHMNKLLA